jgi:hypothetical protein
MIKWDFPKKRRREFDALCSAITRAKRPTIYNQEDYDKAKKSFEAIIAFVDDSRT